jgi:hypothetical protein
MVKSTTEPASSTTRHSPDFLLSPSFTATIHNATELLKNLQHQQIDQQLQQINDYQQKNKLHKQEQKNTLLAQLAAKDIHKPKIGGVDDDSTTSLELTQQFNQTTYSTLESEDKSEDSSIASRTRKRSNSTPARTKKSASTSKPKLTKSKSNGSIRRKSCNRWTKQENERLKQAIAKLGEKKWNDIAQFVGTKNSDQCNQHWHRVINPKISKQPWTEDEDDTLIDRVFMFGESSWKKVAEGLKGRTDIQCRHRYIMLKKYEKQGKGRPLVRKPKKEEELMDNKIEPMYSNTLVERRQFSLPGLDLDEDINMAEDFPGIQEESINLMSPPNFPMIFSPPSHHHDSLRFAHNLVTPSNLLKVSPMHLGHHHHHHMRPEHEIPHMNEWASLDCYEQMINNKAKYEYAMPEFGSFNSDYQVNGSAEGLGNHLDKALNEWNDFVSDSSCSDSARSNVALDGSVDTVMHEHPDWMQHTI